MVQPARGPRRFWAILDAGNRHLPAGHSSTHDPVISEIYFALSEFRTLRSLTVQNTSAKLAVMIVTVAAFKGGVGKTTSAVHLAAYLSRQGETVLVDGDLNRSASRQARRGRFPFSGWDERRNAMAAEIGRTAGG